MARSKSDVSNSAIRMFLHKVGAEYDTLRGYKPFSTSHQEWQNVLNYFNNACCYCAVKLTNKNSAKDHLIPTNRAALGLHAWGNIAPSCKACNAKKHHADWLTFTAKNSAARKRIRKFVKKYKYDVSLKIDPLTKNLYDDVGAVVETLVNLRLTQAKQIISRSLKKRRKV